MLAILIPILSWLSQPTTVQGIALIAGAVTQLITKDPTHAALVGGAALIALPDNTGKLAKAFTTVASHPAVLVGTSPTPEAKP